MTVKELIAELETLPDDLPVHVHDLADGEHFPIERVDPTISDRIEINFRSEQV